MPSILEVIAEGRRGLRDTDAKVAPCALLVTMPAGIVVVPHATAERTGALPTTAALVKNALGILEYLPEEPKDETTGNEYRADTVAAVVKKGQIYGVVETAVTINTVPFVRFAVTTTEQRGAMLATSGGTVVVTPTAVNATLYELYVTLDFGTDQRTLFAQYTSDGSATAAEIVDALAAKLTADPDLLAVNTADTLVLSSTTAFISVVESHASLAVNGSGIGTQVAAPLPNARFRTSTSGAGVALVEIL